MSEKKIPEASPRKNLNSIRQSQTSGYTFFLLEELPI